jgi:hypothetical protein
MVSFKCLSGESLNHFGITFAHQHPDFHHAQSTFVFHGERTFSHPYKNKITILGTVLSPFSFKITMGKANYSELNGSTMLSKLECFKFIFECRFDLLLSLSNILNFPFIKKN